MPSEARGRPRTAKHDETCIQIGVMVDFLSPELSRVLSFACISGVDSVVPGVRGIGPCELLHLFSFVACQMNMVHSKFYGTDENFWYKRWVEW